MRGENILEAVIKQLTERFYGTSEATGSHREEINILNSLARRLSSV